MAWRWLVTLLLAAPLAFAGVTEKDKIETQEDLKELRSRIKEMQRELSTKQEARSDAADSLRESEKAISDTNRTLEKLIDTQRATERDISLLSNDAKVIEGRVATERSRIEQLLRSRYQAGGEGSLKLILKGKNPADVARQLRYYSYVSRARTDLVATLRGDLETLAKLKGDAQSKAMELASLKAEEAKEKSTLEAEQAKRKALLAQISGEIATQRKEIGRLRQDEAALTRLIDQIARTLARQRAEEAARRKAEAAARQKAREAERKRELAEAKKAGKPAPVAKPEPVETVEQAADDSAAGKVFAALRGQLRLPVKGELAGRFGAAREGGGPSWKGLFIRAAAGEGVRAVADGRVVFADWLRGFGNLLIVDHGGGYMTLYGNNESLLRDVGQRVRSGDTLARVGSTGGSADSGVYFEIRHLSRPLDPMSWVAK